MIRPDVVLPTTARPRAARARKTVRKFLRDCRATVAVEFAFTLPILCLMVFGLYEVTQGVIVYTKVYDVANSVADLIGQTTTASTGIGNADFDNMYTAGKMIMAPNTGANLALTVVNVTYDASGTNPTLGWGGTQITRGGGASITNWSSFVSGLGSANGSTIIVKAAYTYNSLLNYFIASPITITAQVAAQPRNYIPVVGAGGIPCPPTNGLETCN